MCGISGIYYFDGRRADHSVTRRMNQTMVLRGPDDEGSYRHDSFGMGMRRLAIIDLKSGQQPLSNEENNIHVVLNGEIYNYRELTGLLQQKGHRFKTQSDVEVLLHLYEDLGTEAIHHLNGMFAFCLYDERKGLVWIARDRLGIKPLYYLQTERFIAFASSLDAFAGLEGWQKEIDEESFLLYLTLAYVPTPRSIYKNIKKLEPGHWLKIENNEVVCHKYWDISVGEFSDLSHEDFVGESLTLLKDSIELQSRSDVPVCSLLSGGIDSSAVTALFCQRSTQAVHTYSVDFEGKAISDLGYAKIISEMYKTQHHPYSVTSDLGFSCLEKLLPLMDEPMADTAIVPSYYLARQAHQHGIKVALSGAGGDELFAGYHRHFHHAKDYFIGRFSLLPQRVWLALGKSLGSWVSHYGTLLHDSGMAFALGSSGVNLGFLQDVLRGHRDLVLMLQLLKGQFLPLREWEAKVGYSYARMIMDVKNYLLDNVLALYDKTSMATSVEGRVPLLDHRLIELVFKTRPANNIANAIPKRSLQEMVQGIVPQEILKRKKTGFNAPVDQWVMGRYRQTILDRLENPVSPIIAKYFAVQKFKQGSGSDGFVLRGRETLFMLYVFDLWYEAHFS